ncbi:uncharacterized protein LOC62_06G008299 [Vanrija pseudolonga]|uniref:Sensor domain-containing protein n=1 Tax=Vanrija pseudolonga TaxID=143232 RepID=A0AAF0YE98_9TREE|nr:hypothetical protein LOC62_06G008299 [Vanrija pseudolonga]
MGTDASAPEDVVAPDITSGGAQPPPTAHITPPATTTRSHSLPHIHSCCPASSTSTSTSPPPHPAPNSLNLHLTMNAASPSSPSPLTPHHPSPAAPVYVLASDGSLFLVDPSKAPENEAPPAYAPFGDRPRAATVSGAVRPAISPRRSVRSGSDLFVDETTPLIPRAAQPPYSPPSAWGAVLYGDDEVMLGAPRASAWRRYWRPVGQSAAWKALFHTLVINFPWALALWPPLLVGTLVGTALLITLPIGAVFWWLTLVLARWAARVELRMQAYFHGVGRVPRRPIFHRDGDDAGFLKLSWAMLSDYYSYSALSYFLLIKPLVVLPSFIALVALFPIALALFPLLPVFLRANRRFGKWQARVALENLA